MFCFIFWYSSCRSSVAHRLCGHVCVLEEIYYSTYLLRFTDVADMEGGSGNNMARSTRSNARAVSALCLLTGNCASSNSKYGDKRTVGTEFLGKRSEVIEYVKVLLNFVSQSLSQTYIFNHGY